MLPQVVRQSGSPKNTRPKGTHGVLVRMPVDLHEQLRRIAERENRPVNGQIVYAIQRHVEDMEEAA